MAKFFKVLEKILTILAVILFIVTIAWTFVAVFDGDNYDEAYINDLLLKLKEMILCHFQVFLGKYLAEIVLMNLFQCRHKL